MELFNKQYSQPGTKIETYHEMTSGLMELYLTSVSLMLNDVMKFLTIFTTVFLYHQHLLSVYMV